MDYLIELVGLLQKSKAQSSELLRTTLEPGSKEERLFELISEGRVRSDEEAAEALYGKAEPSPSYQKVKQRLKERLLRHVLWLEAKDGPGDDRQAAYQDCNQKWAAAQVLLANNAKLNGIDVLEKLLRRTLRFEFTELSLAILRTLRMHYATVLGDQKKFEQANREYLQLAQLWERENRAEELYSLLTISHVHDKSSKAGLSQLAEAYYEEIKPWLQESDAFKLHLLGRLIQMMIYISVNDYQRTAELCEDALAFFEQKPYESGLPFQVFSYQLAVCYIQLRAFEKGQELLEKHHGIFPEGSFNWFKFKELFFLLAMHTGRYTEGAKVCAEALRHPKLNVQPAHITEIWHIYNGYCHLLGRVGELTEAEDRMPKFKWQKFVNDIPLFSRDKRGMNIPILILHIMFLLAERNYEALINRIDAIEKYCSRYLKQNDTFRSNVFIKMLLQIPLASFHKEAVQRKTDKLLTMLKSAPIEIANQSHEIEIIPYEKLWDILIGHLDHKFITPSSGK